jgi:predicted nucleic acid-binding protein
MVICCDTSFLFSIYAHDGHTARAHTWLRRTSAPITVSVLNNYELANALRFAEFRKLLKPGMAAICLAQFQTDLAQGRLRLEVCNLADVLTEANRLSATHTLKHGHRSFDIFHVAAGLHLKAKKFLTFDTNQKKVAKAEKLALPL